MSDHALTLRLDDEMYERLRVQAFERRTTISALIREALSPAAPYTTTREALAEALESLFYGPNRGQGNWLAKADALLASGILVERSEVEAGALTLAELREVDAGPREGCTDACCRAAQLRKGAEQ